MKRLIAMVISVALLVSVNTATAYEQIAEKAVEAPSEWAEKAVDFAYESGIIENWNYEFKNAVAYEEFCEMLKKLISIIKDDGSEISVDTTDLTLTDEEYITREEAAVVIVRTLNLYVPNMPVTELYYDFDDGENISHWASAAVQVVCNLGLMNGMGENKFAPKEFITVEQAIVTLVRMYDCLEAAGLAERNDEVIVDEPLVEFEITETIALENFYIDEAVKLAEKAGELAADENFVNMYVADGEVKENIQSLGKVDYSKPEKMYYITFNVDKIAEFYKGLLKEEGIEEEIDIEKILKYNRYNLSYFANTINARYGAETLAATSVLSNYKGYIMPKEFTRDFGVYLKYNSEYSVLVSYSKIGEGVIEGRINFVRNGEKADMLSFMAELFQSFGEECVSIKIVE